MRLTMKKKLGILLAIFTITGCNVNALTDEQVNNVRELCEKNNQTLIIFNNSFKSEAHCKPNPAE